VIAIKARLKMKHAAFILLFLALGSRAFSQAPFPVDTTKLAERADESTTISLDKTMLQFAGKFLSSSEEDREAQRIIAKLDGIYVRTYEFKSSNSYSASDLDAFRRPFSGPEWSRIVAVHGKESDDTDIYVHMVDGRVAGMFILAAEPGELTFVHIVGAIAPDDLEQLSGNFGIPKNHVKQRSGEGKRR
jgi:Domain of unknown function (DUF4252)